MSKVIVIGGGVNGLVAATRLAQAGRQVTVLERRELLGGIAAGESFHPGYRHVGLSHDGAEVRGSVIKALGLESHGLRLQAPPGLFIAEREGPGLVLQEQGSELAQRAPGDAAGLARWEQLLEAFRPAVRMVLQEAAPDVRQDASLWPLLSKGWMLRGIGEEYLLELLRVGPMCVDDWMAEYVADPLVRTGVIWPALVGAWMGPRSPYSATNLLMDSGAREWEVTGGPAALVGSLVSAAEAAGVRMLTGTEALGLSLIHI